MTTGEDASDQSDGPPFEKRRIDTDCNTDETQLSHYLELLSNRRRRRILYYLEAHEVTDIDSLARHLAETAGDQETFNEREFERAKTSIVHVDLPKLSEIGTVEYDRRNGAVRYRQPPTPLANLLDACTELDAQPHDVD